MENARLRAGAHLDRLTGEASEAAVPDYAAALDFRIARCYALQGRCHEAYWAFVRLEDSAAAADADMGVAYAEEALYGQVRMAADAGRDDRVGWAARRYLRTESFTRFIGEVGHELMQTARRTGSPAAVRELADALVERVRFAPPRAQAAKLIHVVGAALLAEGDGDGLRQRYTPLLTELSGRELADGLHYWLGLADLLQEEYRSGLVHFETLAAAYPNSDYVEDARYREGVCWFGLFDAGRARLRLEGFLADFPQSRLAGEAHALLGDLAAAGGRLDAALNAYTAAREAATLLNPPNRGCIDHAVFQAGRLLAEAGRWAEAADWYESYLQHGQASTRASEAIHRLGLAWQGLGRSDEVSEVWLEAVLRFGRDPDDRGVDRILTDFPACYRAAYGRQPLAVLRDALVVSRNDPGAALPLRLATALRALGEDEPDWPRVEPDNLEQASAAVLLAAAQAERERDPELARAAVERLLSQAPSDPLAEAGWALAAELREAANDDAGAIEAWTQLRERFPTSARAAEANLREGDLWQKRGHTTAALAAYRRVLQVREWRGEAWAEANYKIGLTHFVAGDYEVAFGFCQRVYVLYGSVALWAAEAYLISGLALEELGRSADAIATYRELLQQPNLATEAATARAALRLKELGAS